eukprot:2814442-Prymnesium_polylepis.1
MRRPAPAATLWRVARLTCARRAAACAACRLVVAFSSLATVGKPPPEMRRPAPAAALWRVA